MTVELFGTADRARMDAAIAIRFAVFVDEQGVPPEEELDAWDGAGAAQAVHALALDEGGAPVGTGRFFPLEDRKVQIGRMAVVRAARGRGAGAALLAALLAEARRRGFLGAALNAQDHAVGFYARAGFRPAGAVLMEAGILHQPMVGVLEA